MTFLNPFVLLGLAAAAIPILIHLLNKRKLRTIDFSTLSFLKELQRNKMRKITIRQWLLLLLRTMMVLFLVLAFSRPALKGSFGTIGSHAKTSIAIIIDNTPSMELHNERGLYLDQALEHSSAVISLMQENDDAVIVRLSDLPAVTMDAPSHDRQRLLTVIQETAPSSKRRTISEALRAVSPILRRSKNANKEVYIFTDGQRTTLTSSSGEPAETEPLFDPSTRFYVTRFSDTPAENIGIERVTIPPTVLQVNKPVTVNAVVKNYGSSPVGNHLVSIAVGNKRVMQKSVTLEGGESRTVELSVTPLRSGFLTGSIELEDDNFEPDNRHYFSLSIPDKISIALIASGEQQARFITAAMNAANTLTASGSVNVNTYAPHQISTSMLAAADVVILSGITDLQEPTARLLHQHVAGGGSLIFFPSADTTQKGYRYLEEFSLATAGTVPATANSPITFNRVDLDFPIFAGMFDNTPKDGRNIESPEIGAVLRIPPQTSIRPIITLSNGFPFLWLREYRKGKILGFSVPASSSWSNFVYTGLFVPIVYQSVLYLTSELYLGAAALEFVSGDNMEFTPSRHRRVLPTAAGALRFIDPEQRISPLQYYSTTTPEGISQITYTGSEMNSTGHYFFGSDRDTIMALSVNTDKAESDGSLSSENDITVLLASLGADERSVAFPEPDASLEETVMQSRFGMELWRYFALAAVLLGLLEMIIGRERSTQ
ncbi:MAG: BatA domain-containing protein [Bacteroidota bacterium]